MRIRRKELRRAHKRKADAYKVRTQEIEAKAKTARASKKSEG